MLPRTGRHRSLCSSAKPRKRHIHSPLKACDSKNCAADEREERTLEVPTSFRVAFGASKTDVTRRIREAIGVIVEEVMPTSTLDAGLHEP
ncbi:hypothetical protein AMTR_s00028p00185770 [Amborella trichopoda]|uniref:Uncharacterized protein n=1 Tax=Amborella trichopoda TaxID=13333 RepID=W1PKT9_AMBTC|nr:hypothetical protein AMTR_s00028p00185770 [Amborella trichopoda]